MGIPQLLVFTTVYFLCMVIDVGLFFLMIRALVLRWPTWWLLGFDATGRRLIDGLLLRINNLWYGVFHTHLSDKGQLIAAIVLFYLAWLAVHSSTSVVR